MNEGVEFNVLEGIPFNEFRFGTVYDLFNSYGVHAGLDEFALIFAAAYSLFDFDFLIHGIHHLGENLELPGILCAIEHLFSIDAEPLEEIIVSIKNFDGDSIGSNGHLNSPDGFSNTSLHSSRELDETHQIGIQRGQIAFLLINALNLFFHLNIPSVVSVILL